MCSMEDDPSTYDEFAKTVEETIERMVKEGLIEVKEDDPSVIDVVPTVDELPRFAYTFCGIAAVSMAEVRRHEANCQVCAIWEARNSEPRTTEETGE